MGNYAVVISRAFWILFALESIAGAAMMFLPSRGPYKGWGPEGPVGGGIVLIGVPILLGIPLAIVLIGRSNYATLAGLVFVSWPVVAAIVGPAYSALVNFQAEGRASGDFNFVRPAQRKLAHALQAHDIDSVRALLPEAGDLNAEHSGLSSAGLSLFGFAMANLDHSEASVEIVRAMLAAGANPVHHTPRDKHLMFDAMNAGPEITEMVLRAGANPNQLDGYMPVWWSVFYDDSERGRQTLEVLLNHGADLSLKDGDLGPVGRAASQKNWRAVWLLMQRGAPWKNQRDQVALDEPILAKLEYDLKERRSQHWEIPDEMEKIMTAFRDAGLP
jgi:hypothetical protein